MHLTPAVLLRFEQTYGSPHVVRLEFEMGNREWSLVSDSARRGRLHDVTLYIPRGDELAVIQKPSYPPGVWRTPSGGVATGECIEDGAMREAYEETGLRTEPGRYLLRSEVRFVHGDEAMLWTSHVIEMGYLSGEPHPVDTREVSAARWADLEESWPGQ